MYYIYTRYETNYMPISERLWNTGRDLFHRKHTCSHAVVDKIQLDSLKDSKSNVITQLTDLLLG